MKKIIFLFASLLLVLSACNKNKDEEPIKSPIEGKKVAYVINMPDSDIFQLFAQGVQETASKLGVHCDVSFVEENKAVFLRTVKSYFEDNSYDGLIISHMSNAYPELKALTTAYPNKKVVTFDSEFKDEAGKKAKIEGVTQMFQNDYQLAELLLQFLTANYQTAPEKPVRVLKIWKGPDYLAAFDRRDVAYKEAEAENDIQTIATLPVEKLSTDDEEEVKFEVAKFIEEKYRDANGEPTIDAIWCAYDVYAQGCYKALIAKETYIPMVSVDLSNRDILAMRHNASPWRASACTDFKLNGEQAMRILALELNNEYDKIIDYHNGNAVTDYIEMPGSLIQSDALTPNTTLETIGEIAPASYGDTKVLVTSDWMTKLIGY